jgi:hypothetical protein
VDTAPKASGCFSGGTREIFGAVSEDLLGGTEKAEGAKLPGAGIIPKQCPMEGERTEIMDRNKYRRSEENRHNLSQESVEAQYGDRRRHGR